VDPAVRKEKPIDLKAKFNREGEETELGLWMSYGSVFPEGKAISARR
jgi:hypothetical protein